MTLLRFKGSRSGGTVTAPAPHAGSVQQLIVQSWADVLGRERVLATDDFFDLGALAEMIEPGPAMAAAGIASMTATLTLLRQVGSR